MEKTNDAEYYCKRGEALHEKASTIVLYRTLTKRFSWNLTMGHVYE